MKLLIVMEAPPKRGTFSVRPDTQPVRVAHLAEIQPRLLQELCKYVPFCLASRAVCFNGRWRSFPSSSPVTPLAR